LANGFAFLLKFILGGNRFGGEFKGKGFEENREVFLLEKRRF
jgi:hypothetical protein